jgi:hypothetical protein
LIGKREVEFFTRYAFTGVVGKPGIECELFSAECRGKTTFKLIKFPSLGKRGGKSLAGAIQQSGFGGKRGTLAVDWDISSPF